MVDIIRLLFQPQLERTGYSSGKRTFQAIRIEVNGELGAKTSDGSFLSYCFLSGEECLL